MKKESTRYAGSLASGFACWVCGSHDLRLAKPSDISSALDSSAFAVTDSQYGRTAEIHRCARCGFLQCSHLADVLPFYENLVDPSYEEGREARGLQARKLLRFVRRYQPAGRLLDIGAGSGILVEQALEMGYRAEGIEASRGLQAKARERGLPVHLGTFPHANASGSFQIVTLIDVLEHLPGPVGLLADVAKVLAPDGVALIVTPDVRSIAARLMGWKWWHVRVAHIGYFTRETLAIALDRAGLQPLACERPAWYFPLDYLAERAGHYLPGRPHPRLPRLLGKVVVRLNLRDSMAVVVGRKP